MTNTWTTRIATKPPCAHWPDKVVLSGPGIAEMVQELFLDLALSIHDGDGRASAFSDYVIAVGTLRSDPDSEYLNDRVAEAWEALEPELAMDLYLSMPGARLIAHLLDDVAGRVGIERRAA